MKLNSILLNITVHAILICVGAVSSFAQTNWTKDATNPVLRRDTVYANLPNDLIAISDCWVMKQGTQYKMWYTCGGINYPADTLLRSRICYCESTDGVNWTKYSGNPVMDVSYTGGWDSSGVETVTIIVDSAAPATHRYKMWYAGQTVNSYRYDIGYAYSPDGLNWTKHPGAVLQVGASNEWDNGFLEGPSVIKDGGIYKMWYCGYDVVVDGNGTDGHANIGYATSTDGINWTKYSGNPVLSTGINSWDSILVQDPHVIKENGIYYMWYGGNDVGSYGQKVGYAWSSDGINWIKSSANPVLTNGITGEWDSNTASFPSILNDNGIYKMWYTGKDVDPIPSNLNYYWEIGYATAPITFVEDISSDSNNVSVYPNPFTMLTTIQTPELLHNATLTIYNSFGQEVRRTENISGQSITVHRDNLSAGVYVMQLTEGDTVFPARRIVITD
jgi:predicted GH43/DUF377 family glycosyl hydrolase